MQLHAATRATTAGLLVLIFLRYLMAQPQVFGVPPGTEIESQRLLEVCFSRQRKRNTDTVAGAAMPSLDVTHHALLKTYGWNFVFVAPSWCKEITYKPKREI